MTAYCAPHELKRERVKVQEMAAMGDVEYQLGSPDSVDVEALAAFYAGQNHPIKASPEKLRRMVERSACFVTARKDGRLVGIARGLTDGVRGYLTECKLDPLLQGPAAVTRTDGRIEHDTHGIARRMAMHVLKSLHEQGVERVDVTAYGTEEDFCSELGFTRARGAVAMQMVLPVRDKNDGP